MSDFRWCVFQHTPKGTYRLTQWLYAPDKRIAEQKAKDQYAGCAGTLTVMSAAEEAAMRDDESATQRTRIAPKPIGQRRYYKTRRGPRYGTCRHCGTLTVVQGGPLPEFCKACDTIPIRRTYRIIDEREKAS
jgi:1,2-phenylacetyl-CoA epoxidase PaaB subunit